jgi:hypothetical protein
MTRYRVLTGVLVVAGALSLAACSSSTTKSASTTSTAPSTTAAKLSGGSNPTGSFCTAYDGDTAAGAKIEPEIQNAATQPWATSQTAFENIFTEGQQAATQLEGVLKSAPANVQAAVPVIVTFFQQAESATKSATSLAGFTTALETLSQATAFQNASQVLTAYATAQCGSTTTTTSAS